MINGKHLLIISLAIGIIVAISPLYASDISIMEVLNITPFSENTVVNIDGIDFNIPKGYGEEIGGLTKDGEIRKLHGVDFITFNHHYLNNDSDSINIDIFYDEHKKSDLNMLSKDSGEVDKKIDGIDGLFLQEEGYCTFTYILDGKTIMLTAKNETLISDIMI